MKRIVIWVEDEVKEKLLNECFLTKKDDGKNVTQTEIISKLINKYCKKGKKS